MKLYAQHGWGVGGKVGKAYQDNVIHGVIMGPRDETPERCEQNILTWSGEHIGIKLLIDPQLYTTFLAGNSNAKMGNLFDYPFFPGARRRNDYEQIQNIENDIRNCFDYQSNLPLSGWIAPNIIPERFDSILGSISKNFIRNTNKIKNEYDAHPPIYATLALSLNMLLERDELDQFLEEITL